MKSSTLFKILGICVLGAMVLRPAIAEKKAVSGKMLQFQDKMHKDLMQEEQLKKKMIGMILSMVTVLKDYDVSARSMSGMSGLGRVEQLQFKAERYSAERQIRKRVEKEIFELADIVQQWQNYQGKVQEWKRLIAMEKRVEAIKSTVKKEEKAKSQSGFDSENVEYYTVKKSGNLKQISGLREVYGNVNAWKYLYDANRDKVTHPNATVSAGTTLMVPNIKDKMKFINLD